MMVRLVVFLVVLSVGAACHGSSDSPAPTAGAGVEALSGEMDMEAPADGEMFFTVLRLVGALLVIIGLIYATVYVLKVLITKKRRAGGGGGMIDVLERTYLGPGKELCLVRVMERVFLLGVNGAEVRMLSEVEPGGRGDAFADALGEELSSRPEPACAAGGGAEGK